MRKSLYVLPLALLLSATLPHLAAEEAAPRGEVRTLTPKAEGKQPVEVLITKVEDGQVTFRPTGMDQDFTYPITAFSDADQEHLDGWEVPPPPPHVPSVNEHLSLIHI